MGQPLQNVSTYDLVYDYLLSARYRSPWVYDPTLAFLKDADVWNVIMADADIRGIRQRRNQNIIRPWRVQPNPHASSRHVERGIAEASKRVAAIAGEGLSSIQQFDMSRFLLADAFSLGRRYAKVEYEEMALSLDGTPAMTWYVPTRLKDVDRRRFHWVPEWTLGENARKTVHLEMFDTNSMRWVKIEGDERRKYIEYVWEDSEDRLGHGFPAFEALFFTHYFKTQAVTKLIQFLDRLANGMLIGKLDSLRAASSDLDNASLTTSKAIQFLQKIRTDKVGVLGDGDSVELLESNGTGSAISMECVRYFTESAERLYNGAVRQAGHSVDGSGARAAAETESDTAENYYQFPREDLDAVLDRDLLGGFLYFNEANFAELGLEIGTQAKRPRFVSEQIKRQNPAERIEVLNKSKVPIGRAYYYDQLDAPMPDPDEEVVEPSADPAMMDAQLNERTGFPEKSDEARRHEKDLARDKGRDDAP